jgi:acyl dehydratase
MEDFHVGQKFTAGPMTVTAQDITAFAEQFDPQDFHTDSLKAKNTVFGEQVASGWHTAALSMRLMLSAVPEIEGGMVGRSIEKLQWPRPVRPGDSLSITIEILEMRVSASNPARGITRIKAVTHNQNNDPVQEMETVIFMPRREKPAA